MRFGLLTLCACLFSTAILGQNKTQLRAEGFDTNGYFTFNLSKPLNYVYTVDAASTLPNWLPIATLVGDEDNFTNEFLPFTDPSTSSDDHRFYRVRTSAITPTTDWKNQVFYPRDSFQSLPTRWDGNETLWIKFAIKTNEPNRVYFQNSSKYLFHYDFAKARLPEFQSMSRAEFDEVSLHPAGQKIILGSLLYAPNANMREAGIQFVGLEPYSREQIARWFHVVKSALAPVDYVNTFYIPTFEQAALAEAEKQFLSSKGIEIRSVASWNPGDNCYAPGWALGTLKYFPVGEVQNAYRAGQLLPTDILLVDNVPAELPFLAGILTLNAATPNSHVAILAKSYGIPFGHLGSTELRQQAMSLTNKQVIFDTTGKWGVCDISLIDVGNLTTELKQSILAYKEPPALTITPKARLGSYTTNTESLYPPDIKYVGGKAANFGFLRRTIPTNSPAAIAITFDLWDDFLDQNIAPGKTLRQEISTRLSQYTSYPPNVGAVATDLALIRNLIEDDTSFTPAQMEAIASALLSKFEPNTKIRFRSSTNVEDSENFSGAGLYDSYSGCLADDRDSNSTGPSLCDPDEPRERGVFRAIRKVYASFYNDNAFLERLRHSIDESQVGMAILVHYSAPDPTEMANGVATVEFDKTPQGHSFNAELVTQKGAVSVTNPDGSAIPEIVQVGKFFDSTYPTFIQGSSLVPLGGYVLNWGKEGDGLEYKQFAELFDKVSLAFEAFYPAKQNYILDFEYKKMVPGALIVKQVRQIPLPASDKQIETFILNQPAEYCVFQGEWGDVFANHRLKSRFQFTTRDLEVTPANLAQTIFGPTHYKYVLKGRTNELTGSPSTWPGAAHSTSPLTDSWTFGAPAWARLTLTPEFPRTVPATESPVLTLVDMDLILSADYIDPQFGINSFQEPDHAITNESVRLIPCPTTNAFSIPVTRTVGTTPKIITSFYWPEPPSGVSAGYTAPLMAWKETTITGLTTEPIVLRGYYSQTYRPHHHNFGEDFLFEPRLEPGISPAQLEELESNGTHLIWLRWGGLDSESKIYLINDDGTVTLAGGKP